MKPKNETVVKYWLEYYVRDGACSLCRGIRGRFCYIASNGAGRFMNARTQRVLA